MGVAVAGLVALVGVVVAGAGIACLVAPARFRRLLSRWTRKRWINAGILLRLAAGLVFLAGAPQTGLPRLVLLLGIVTLAAGLLTPLLGYHRLFAFADWWAARPTSLIRLWALLATGLGLLIVYAAAW
jgi:hypothetical protein